MDMTGEQKSSGSTDDQPERTEQARFGSNRAARRRNRKRTIQRDANLKAAQRRYTRARGY